MQRLGAWVSSEEELEAHERIPRNNTNCYSGTWSVKTLELSRGGEEHKGSAEAILALAALSLKTLQGKATS